MARLFGPATAPSCEVCGGRHPSCPACAPEGSEPTDAEVDARVRRSEELMAQAHREGRHGAPGYWNEVHRRGCTACIAEALASHRNAGERLAACRELWGTRTMDSPEARARLAARECELEAQLQGAAAELAVHGVTP